MELVVLSRVEAIAHVPALAELLVDAVAGGASVNFVHPFSVEDAAGFWEAVLVDDRRLVLALDGERIDGCVLLQPAPQPNQPHRADVGKMLVHSRARRQGLGARLLAAVEAEALALGRDLLTLDTATGSAGERLYTRAGWTKIGEVPGFATAPDGVTLEAASFFYKQL